jgi:hypothetical protein
MWKLSTPTTMMMMMVVAVFLFPSQATATADTDDFISHDESPTTQWTLGKFEVRLSPTPEPLANVDNILGAAIEEVVRKEMQRSCSEIFEYMYVAGVNHIDVQVMDGGATRRTRTIRRRTLQATTTLVVFNGGVVAFDGEPSGNVNDLVKSSIESELKDVLIANGGPWALIEDIAFTDLEATDAPTDAPTTTSPTSAPTTTSPTSAPTTSSPTTSQTTTSPDSERTVAPPTGGVSGLQEQNNVQSDSDGASIQQIMGGVFGIAFVLLGSILLARTSRRNSRQQHTAEALTHAELDDKDMMNDQYPSGSSRSKLAARELTSMAADHKYDDLHTTDSGNAEQLDRTFLVDESETEQDHDDERSKDRSEMAQYAPGELLDSISVGAASSVASSEWNGDDTATAISIGNSSVGVCSASGSSPTSPNHQTMQSQSRVAAMAYASNETFERDRLVALQKDLLQSDWTHDPLRSRQGDTGMASIATFARPKVSSSSSVNTNSSSSKKKSNNNDNDNDNNSSSMSFEQAYEDDSQGEEIYLMPPSRKTRGSGRRRNRDDDDNDDDDDDGSDNIV